MKGRNLPDLLTRLQDALKVAQDEDPPLGRAVHYDTSTESNERNHPIVQLLAAEQQSTQWRSVMFRILAIGHALILMLSDISSVWAAEFGTAEEAKAMLERAVVAVKADKTKALDMFNNGEGGFKDRDLYVWCANAADGIVTAQPYMNRGKQLRDIQGKHGSPFGETIMQNATEGAIKVTTYWWPRPGSDEPFEKKTFYTKVGDQICGVGYYNE
jgi:hypothetical protein